LIINIVQEYDNEAENLIHGLAYNCSDEDLDLGKCSSWLLCAQLSASVSTNVID